MNREEILNLPDEEINRLIATKWMGWKPTDNPNIVIMDDRDWICLVPSLGGSWMPSTNLSDAMEALEKHSRFSINRHAEDWYIEIYLSVEDAQPPHPSKYIQARSVSKSLPKAICQCILLYLNEKGEL